MENCSSLTGTGINSPYHVYPDPVTQGEDCPLDATHRPYDPEAMPVLVSINGELGEKKHQHLLHVLLFLSFLLTVTGSCLVGTSQDIQICSRGETGAGSNGK